MTINRFRLAIIILLIIGFALRIIAVFALPVEPVSDFKRYYDLAEVYARTGRLEQNGIPFVFQPPAFAVFLGAVFYLFHASITVGKIANLLVALLSLLIFVLAVRRMPLREHLQNPANR